MSERSTIDVSKKKVLKTYFIIQNRSDYNAEAIPSSEESQPETITPKNSSNRIFSEYEEIYNAQENHLKNMSLNSYSNTLNRLNSKTSALNEHCHEIEISQKAYHQPKPMPPRPRSADFLEYESKKQMQKLANMRGGSVDSSSHRLPSRPKSSLDINRSDCDNYYYSEASYAAKMRQSAQYLQSKNVMRPQSALKDEFNRNTLRYENERKRLTSEFQSYTAAAAAASKSASINTNSLPSDFQRAGSDLGLSDEWKLSPLKRKGVYSTDEQLMTFRDDTPSSQSFLNTKLLRSESKKLEIHNFLAEMIPN